MDYAIVLGVIAAMLTTICQVPQVYKSWSTKHTKDISWLMYLLLFTGVSLWLIYGIIIRDIPLMLANSLTAALVLAVLILKARYG